MSASVGAVLVVNLEHLLHDLANRGQWVELTSLNLVEQPPELGVVADGVLQVGLCPRRGDREHLAREVPPAPLLEAAVLLQERPVPLDLVPQLVDVLASASLP